MSTGDIVSVFRVGEPTTRKNAEVVMASANDNCLALAFPDGERFPPGLPPLGFAMHPDHGPMLLLLRDETRSPFWVDLFSGHFYGIEAAS